MPSSFRRLKDHVGRIEAIVLREEIVMIGSSGGSREQELDEPDACRNAQRLLVDLMPVGIGDHAQPAEQRGIDAGAHALEDALKQMVMGRDQPRINHAIRRIDELLAGKKIQVAHLRDASVDNPDRSARAHRGAGKPGEYTRSALDQGGAHVSTPTSLSCHAPSASLERATIKLNKATPAAVMSSIAANMRGMSSAKPACRIS